MSKDRIYRIASTGFLIGSLILNNKKVFADNPQPTQELTPTVEPTQTLPEIKSVNLANSTYVDSNGKRNNLTRLFTGGFFGKKPELVPFKIQYGTLAPIVDVGGIFERWEKKVITSQNGKVAEMVFAIVKVPIKGRLVEVKAEFNPQQMYVGINPTEKDLIEDPSTGTPYVEMTFKRLEKLDFLKLGTQVDLEIWGREEYDKEIKDGYLVLNTPEKQAVYNVIKPFEEIQKIFKDIEKGKKIDSDELIFPANMRIPAVGTNAGFLPKSNKGSK